MSRCATGMGACALVALYVFLVGFSLTDRAAERAEFVAGLRQDLVKVDHAIEVTRALLERSAGADHQPDVLFRLAELHVEKSRLLYYLQVETEGTERARRSPQAMFYKNEALNLYADLMHRFPAYRHRDKVLFCMAHEYDELGLQADKLATYRRLVEDFPRSAYLPEALFLMGEHHFDRDELDAAEAQYRKVLAYGASPFGPRARYKLGWIAVNRARRDKRQWATALGHFERVAKGADSAGDLRTRAIDGIVFCYTEVRTAAGALDYFRALAASHTGYVRALTKLANRYFIKEQFGAAALIYRRIIALSPDAERSLDYAQRIYDASSLAADKARADQDVLALATAVSRVASSWRIDEGQRERLGKEFEVYARDLVTKLHLQADQRKELRSYRAAARAYGSYLAAFGDAADGPTQRINHAEALFNARQYLQAGRAYERIARRGGGQADPKDLLYSALQAYQRALGDQPRLDRAARLECRQAIRQLGARFTSRYPEDPRTATIAFNVARMLFEQGHYREAVGAFEAYLDHYPGHTERPVAAHLILDCLERLRDYQAVVDRGRALMAADELGDGAFDRAVKVRVEQAGRRLADRAVIGAVEQGEDPVGALIRVADLQKSEEVLVRAFDLANQQRDARQAFTSGAKLVDQHPASKQVPRVFATLSNLCVETGDFERAAALNEEFFQRRPQDPNARQALARAAHIRAMLAEHDRAVKDLRRLVPARPRLFHLEYMLSLTRSLAELGRWEEVEVAARQVLQLRADQPEATLLLARALEQRGDRAAAEQAYLAAVTPGPGSATSAEALFRLAALFQADFRAAAPAATRADAAWLERGLRLYTQAQRLYTEAIGRRVPAWTVAAVVRLATLHADLAGVLRRVPADGDQVRAAIQAQAAQAEDSARQARALCASAVHEHRVLGPYALACIRGGEPVLAPPPRRPAARPVGQRVLDFRARLVAKPTDSEAMLGLARLSLEAGDPHLARVQLQVILERSEGHAPARNLMGLAAWLLGDHQQALEEFDLALAADPGLLSARLNRAALLVLYDDLAGARRSLGEHLHSARLDGKDLHPSVRAALARLRSAASGGRT